MTRRTQGRRPWMTRSRRMADSGTTTGRRVRTRKPSEATKKGSSGARLDHDEEEHRRQEGSAANKEGKGSHRNAHEEAGDHDHQGVNTPAH
eukprot:13484776-Heterocapsa_arctica.AAC.1